MFRTKVEIPHAPIEITHHHKIMTMGSCFSENIGQKMKNAYFLTENNPFGVLYNPLSIQNSIELLIINKHFGVEDIFQHQSLWHSFSHSSLYSDISSEGCIRKINSSIIGASQFLSQTDFLLITFGTAWIFENRKTGKAVSNCHKLPASDFNRRKLSVDEIVNNYGVIIQKLQQLFPALQLIFTVSPIRHWKDGAHDNNLSKSVLLLAIESLKNKFDRVHYFPAYEIQMDELRDYRFYASDMLHPSEVAIDYIWKRFAETFFSTETLHLKKRLEQLYSDESHRPLHPESAEYEQFIQNMELRKKQIITDFPFLSDRI